MYTGDEGHRMAVDMDSEIGNGNGPVFKSTGENQKPKLSSMHEPFNYIDSPARFFGEPLYTCINSIYPKALSPSDFSLTEFPPSEVSNNTEVLREINLKLANELRVEKSKSRRFYVFASRLAKKLGCLGQLSSNELKTCFSLGIQIEVSNLHWLLYRSPWAPTRDVAIGTGDVGIGKDENNNEITIIATTAPEKKYETKTTILEIPKRCKYIPQVYQGIAAISLPMPNPYATGTVDGQNQKQGGYLAAINQKQIAEHRLASACCNEETNSHDSIIVLHQAPIEPYPVESSTEMNSILQTSPPLDKDGDSRTRTVTVGIDVDESQSLIKHNQDMLVHCKESLEHMDQVNQHLRGDIQVAIESTKNIKAIASFLSNFVSNHDLKSYGLPTIPEISPPVEGPLGIPIINNYACKSKAQPRKSQIPVRIPQPPSQQRINIKVTQHQPQPQPSFTRSRKVGEVKTKSRMKK